MDQDLEAIRAARLAELQGRALGGGQGRAQGQGQGQTLGQPQGPPDLLAVMARILEPSARERLSRVRIVRPERADQVEQYIVRLHQMGGITHKLTEKDIVQILDGISRDQQSNGPKITYNRKHSAMDLDLDLDLDDGFE